MNPSLVSSRYRFVPLLVAGILLGVPISAGIGYLVAGAAGLAGNSDAGGFARVLHDGAVLRSVLFSLWIAGAGTLLSLAGALFIAFLTGSDSRIERLTRATVVVPLPVPNVAAAVAILLLLSQSGWLARVGAHLQLLAAPEQFPAMVYDRWAIGVIATIVWKEMPFLLLVALSLQSLRGPSLTDTARTLGATRWQTLRTVTLPLLLRGMAPSIIALFVFVVGSLELPMVLAPSSPLALPLLIQERRQSTDMAAHGESYAIALLAAALALLAVLAHERLRSDEPT